MDAKVCSHISKLHHLQNIMNTFTDHEPTNCCHIVYIFLISGCDVCPLPGQVCDPKDGTCVCPPNTEGAQCERCTPFHWGYDWYRGCKVGPK